MDERINERTNKSVKTLVGIENDTVYDMGMNKSFNSLLLLC